MTTSAKEMNRLDLIHIVKQFAELGYQACEIAGILNLNESTVRAYIND